MRRLAAFVAAAMLGLVACGAPAPTAGMVVAKSYDDPDDYTINGACLVHVNVGQVPVCTMYQQIPQHDGPHWKLRLRSSDGDEGWREVTLARYEKCRVGRWCQTH